MRDLMKVLYGSANLPSIDNTITPENKKWISDKGLCQNPAALSVITLYANDACNE